MDGEGGVWIGGVVDRGRVIWGLWGRVIWELWGMGVMGGLSGVVD